MQHLEQQDHYVDDPRLEVVPHVPRTATSALDVGCSCGGFGRSLRTLLGPDATIVGIEPVAEPAERARQTGAYTQVLDGYFPDAVPAGQRFDVITFNDVLEHVVDPWQMVRQSLDHLTDQGRVVAAIPNIQYVRAVAKLMRGDWTYTDTGILDRTHVRFFTRKTMIELFEQNGFIVESCTGANGADADWAHHPRGLQRSVKLFAARRGWFGDFLWLHFIITARPATNAESSPM